MSKLRVKNNRVVSVKYRILDTHGEVLEQMDTPVSFIAGPRSGLFPKIDKALQGLKEGDTVDVELSPSEGFGQYNPDLTFTDDVVNVPPQFRRIGAEVTMQNDRGEERKFYVTRIEDGKLTVDANHPYAGKTVVFKVEVVEIRKPTAEELQRGVPASADVRTLH
jgi:FKBP-type peptidyl-prolyl cis-trans isomerase SlyD